MAAVVPDVSGFMKPDVAAATTTPPAKVGTDHEDDEYELDETESVRSSVLSSESESSAVMVNARGAENPGVESRAPPTYARPKKVRSSSSASTASSVVSGRGRQSRGGGSSARKLDILEQLRRFESKGETLRRKFSMMDSLEDLEEEIGRILTQRNVESSIKFQRKMLMAVTTGVEFLNGRYDPFGVNLDGWSESLYDGIGEYDDVFEELYMKYRGKSQLPPEIRLMMMMAGSGFMFHLTNTMFRTSTIPGVEQVMRQNPDLMKQFAGAAANMMSQTNKDTTGMAGLFGNMFGGGQASAGTQRGSFPAPPPQMQAPMPPQGQASGGPRMKGPTGASGILSQLQPAPVPSQGQPQSGGAKRIPTDQISIVTESDVSDLLDFESIKTPTRSVRAGSVTGSIGRNTMTI